MKWYVVALLLGLMGLFIGGCTWRVCVSGQAAPVTPPSGEVAPQ